MSPKERTPALRPSIQAERIFAVLKQAVALHQQGDVHRAEQLYRQILSVDPNNSAANSNLGLIAEQFGHIDLALRFFKKADKFNPQDPELNLSLGRTYQSLGDTKSAIIHYRKAVSLSPKNALAHYSLGSSLQFHGDSIAAAKCYLKALSLDPTLTEALANLGLLQTEKGDIDKAILNLEKALATNSDHIESHYNLSVALLLDGQLHRGWIEQEWRIKQKDGRVRQLPFQPWEGEDLAGKHILVFAEQGVGDEVMFASCLPDLLALKPAAITLECDPRLEPLFARSFTHINVRGINRTQPIDWKAELPSVDLQIPIGSLPLYFRNSETAFPQRTPFLLADNDKIEKWRHRYKALGNRPKIGISWRGGAKVAAKTLRSTQLRQWRSILTKDAHFVNLQYGDCKKELSELEKKIGVKVYDWIDADPLTELDDFAAQVAALDLVISVDNSTVHFAAAVGTPVWTFLPHVPEFRWMLARTDSPWYPTMRLFRQDSPNGWDELFSRVEATLQHWLEKKSP